MNSTKNHHEKGQIIILLALGLVALFGFTALAIDGGAVFFDRRSAQNAADAAALAGVQALAKDPWPVKYNLVTSDPKYVALESAIKSAALNRAHDNHYGTSDGKTVVVTWPLTDFNGIHQMGGDNNLKNYVKVEITSTVNTSFVHLIGFGRIANTVVAVAHIIPPDPGPAFSGAGMVALAPHKDGAITANGNAVITVAGGGVFVNSDSASSITATSGSLQFYTPTSSTIGDYDPAKVNMDVVPGPETRHATNVITYPPDLPFPDPVAKCSTLAQSTTTSWTNPDDGNIYTVYSEGTWPSIPGDLYVKLAKGIHCFSIKNGGDNINNKQTWINAPEGVLIVFTGIDPCNVTINASAHVHLNSQSGPPYKGLMIYVDPKGFTLNYNDPKTTGGGPLQLNGGENILLKGTIYAPACTIKMNGDGGNSYRGQIVGFNFDIAGGALVKLLYIDSDNIDAKPQSQVDLNQ